MIRKVIFLTIVILIILSPLFLWLIWNLQPKKPVNILIIDKTVPNHEYQEHQGFNWILKNSRYVQPDGDFYEKETDYFGFHPGEGLDYTIRDFDNFSEKRLDSLAHAYDMAYVADVYGVYYNDWYLRANFNEFSPLIYGGLLEEEVRVMEKMHGDRKLLVAEFNFMAHPTPGKVRRRAQELFGFHWTGWTARYFNSLDTTGNEDLPKWVVRLYCEQTGKEWGFTGPGMVYVHENQSILILDKETCLEKEIPYIRTEEEYCDEFGVPEEIYYAYWFDVIEPNDSLNEIISTIHVFPNEKGSRLLRSFNLPTMCPAAIRNRHDHLTWYFSGDFCDNDIPFRFVRLSGIWRFHKLLSHKTSFYDRVHFYWAYYYPVMKKVLGDYYEKLERQ